MARTRAPDRLDRILDAARDVFLATSYRRARMADVARVAGVSPGLLYSYATGKDALFHLVLQREVGMPIDRDALPLGDPDFDALQAFGRKALGEVATLPALERGRSDEAPADVRAEIAAIVAELYDRVDRYRVFITLMERSAEDRPDLAARFYGEGRAPLVDRIADHLARRSRQGLVAPLPDAHVAARYLVEVTAWFANHRHGDRDGSEIDDSLARATVVELTTRALVGP
jgi:AcrR family transcriptional regulator